VRAASRYLPRCVDRKIESRLPHTHARKEELGEHAGSSERLERRRIFLFNDLGFEKDEGRPPRVSLRRRLEMSSRYDRNIFRPTPPMEDAISDIGQHAGTCPMPRFRVTKRVDRENFSRIAETGSTFRFFRSDELD